MNRHLITTLTILAFGTAAHADITITGTFGPANEGEYRPSYES